MSEIEQAIMRARGDLIRTVKNDMQVIVPEQAVEVISPQNEISTLETELLPENLEQTTIEKRVRMMQSFMLKAQSTGSISSQSSADVDSTTGSRKIEYRKAEAFEFSIKTPEKEIHVKSVSYTASSFSEYTINSTAPNYSLGTKGNYQLSLPAPSDSKQINTNSGSYSAGIGSSGGYSCSPCRKCSKSCS